MSELTAVRSLRQAIINHSSLSPQEHDWGLGFVFQPNDIKACCRTAGLGVDWFEDRCDTKTVEQRCGEQCFLIAAAGLEPAISWASLTKQGAAEALTGVMARWALYQGFSDDLVLESSRTFLFQT